MVVEYLVDMVALVINKTCTRSILLDTFVLETAEVDKVSQKSRDVGDVVKAEFSRSIEGLYGNIGSAITIDF
jgi:hypothetical protein